jgi:DNA-directed RNA polymerase specialized sigma subunit
MEKVKIQHSELDLISKVKVDNCNDSFGELSKLYDNFYYSIAQKYSSTLVKAGMNKDDIKYEKDFILYKAVKSFDAKQKTKFSTWFCNCVKYHFLNYINSNKKYILAEENKIDFFNNKDILVCVDKNNDTYSYLLSLLSSFKDERIRQVYELRYFSGGEKLATWNSIAKKLGVSTQTAINLHEKTRSFLKNKVQSKNSCDFV